MALLWEVHETINSTVNVLVKYFTSDVALQAIFKLNEILNKGFSMF